VLAFRMGGPVKLVPKPRRAGFAVAWVLAPELAEAGANRPTASLYNPASASGWG
jgi:hypothetical protein